MFLGPDWTLRGFNLREPEQICACSLKHFLLAVSVKTAGCHILLALPVTLKHHTAPALLRRPSADFATPQRATEAILARSILLLILTSAAFLFERRSKLRQMDIYWTWPFHRT